MAKVAQRSARVGSNWFLIKLPIKTSEGPKTDPRSWATVVKAGTKVVMVKAASAATVGMTVPAKNSARL